MTEIQDYITAEEAAQALNLSISGFWYHKVRGHLPEPIHSIGKRFFYSRAQIDKVFLPRKRGRPKKL